MVSFAAPERTYDTQYTSRSTGLAPYFIPIIATRWYGKVVLTQRSYILPLVTVIVPAHNCAEYLPSLFRSVLMQTKHYGSSDPVPNEQIELIVVDDGSVDATPTVVEEYSSQFANFVYIKNDKAGGVSKARNQGTDIAQGQYIQFLDGDDWLSPGYFRTAVDAISSLNVDFIRVDHTRVTGNSRVLQRAPMGVRNRPISPRSAILPISRTTMVDYPFPWAGMSHIRMRDKGLLHYEEDLHTAEDRALTWKTLLHADSFAVISSSGVCYRRGLSNSLTQIYDERQLGIVRAFEKILSFIREASPSDGEYRKATRSMLALFQFQAKRLTQRRDIAQSLLDKTFRPDDPAVEKEVIKLRKSGFSEVEEETALHTLNNLLERFESEARQLAGTLPNAYLMAEFLDTSEERFKYVRHFMPNVEDATRQYINAHPNLRFEGLK